MANQPPSPSPQQNQPRPPSRALFSQGDDIVAVLPFVLRFTLTVRRRKPKECVWHPHGARNCTHARAS
jgi:hypothetical protein